MLKNFVRARVLLVGHHLFLPFFIYPVFMGGLQSFGGGDCLVAAGFLLEASTPFVSLRKILAILGKPHTNILFIIAIPTLESRINEQVVYWKMEKNPTYTHLFGTIHLLFFSKKSHLYVYSVLYSY